MKKTEYCAYIYNGDDELEDVSDNAVTKSAAIRMAKEMLHGNVPLSQYAVVVSVKPLTTIKQKHVFYTE